MIAFSMMKKHDRCAKGNFWTRLQWHKKNMLWKLLIFSKQKPHIYLCAHILLGCSFIHLVSYQQFNEQFSFRQKMSHLKAEWLFFDSTKTLNTWVIVYLLTMTSSLLWYALVLSVFYWAFNSNVLVKGGRGDQQGDGRLWLGWY